jgi:hypothetical protein
MAGGDGGEGRLRLWFHLGGGEWGFSTDCVGLVFQLFYHKLQCLLYIAATLAAVFFNVVLPVVVAGWLEW